MTQQEYVPSIGHELIQALIRAMGPNQPTLDEMGAVITYFKTAYTAAGLLVAIEKGACGLEQEADDWHITNTIGEPIATFRPDRTQATHA